MIFRSILFMTLAMALPAAAQTTNSVPSAVMQATGPAQGANVPAIAVDASHELWVKFHATPLPSDASTGTLQTTGNTTLNSLLTQANRLALDSSIQTLEGILNAGITVNIGTLNGISTASKQDLGNTSLASILALQPALNGDGGALSHVTNFPSSFGISGTLPAYASTPTFNIGSGTVVHLDNVTLSGSGPTTVLNSGHSLHGGVVTPTSDYCINVTGAPAGTANSTDGTECYFGGQSYGLPSTGNAISINGLAAGTVAGHGST